MNENTSDRKQGVLFGVFDVCGLVNFNVLLPKRTSKRNPIAHAASHLSNFQFYCLRGISLSPETAPNYRSRTPIQYSDYD